MLKQTITYKNWDDVPQEKTLYFNLSRADLLENIEVLAGVDDLNKLMGGPERQLLPHEVQKIVDFIKQIAKLSYGVRRNVDGEDTFSKKPEHWQLFTETAAYDAWFSSLFEDEMKLAFDFIVGVMPPELVAQVQAENPELRPGESVRTETVDAPVLQAAPPVLEETTNFEGTGYSRESLLSLDDEMFRAAVGNDEDLWSKEILKVALERQLKS